MKKRRALWKYGEWQLSLRGFKKKYRSMYIYIILKNDYKISQIKEEKGEWRTFHVEMATRTNKGR